ncbi:carbonic anhydrase [Methyloligella solikamskensis]|uniref:carbonic anhydrase n=1 Tax=Methyloligella solikamskensis TaxID=1177756 RepID=A0ABW3J7M7_9HYPH
MPLPKDLVEGHRRFRRDIHASERGRYRQLAELGQTPTALVIGCCDARVDVSKIFDAEPGELFILRNVANLVPPYEPEGFYHGTSAAIEFAVLGLKVPHIIIGHSHCGGISAYRKMREGENIASEGPSFLGGGDSFISRWMTLLEGIELNESDVATYGEVMAMELAGVRSSLAKLRSFPALKEREAQGLVSLHGLHLDIGDNKLVQLDPAHGYFAPII